MLQDLTFLVLRLPKVKTIAIGESTENVVLGICPKVWCRLPKEGVIVLEVRHTAEASGASLPVFISVSGSVSTASNTRNIPLVNASSEPITGSQVSAGNRYIAYFNKCDKESLSKIDEEMRRCEDILKILNINSDITTNVTKDFKELDDLKAEVKELKQLLQNVSAVRPEVIKNTPPNSAEDKKVEPEGEIKKEI